MSNLSRSTWWFLSWRDLGTVKIHHLVPLSLKVFAFNLLWTGSYAQNSLSWVMSRSWGAIVKSPSLPTLQQWSPASGRKVRVSEQSESYTLSPLLSWRSRWLKQLSSKFHHHIEADDFIISHIVPSSPTRHPKSPGYSSLTHLIKSASRSAHIA